MDILDDPLRNPGTMCPNMRRWAFCWVKAFYSFARISDLTGKIKPGLFFPQTQDTYDFSLCQNCLQTQFPGWRFPRPLTPSKEVNFLEKNSDGF